MLSPSKYFVQTSFYIRTTKSEVAQACMTAIHYNKLRTKISNKKYAKLVKTVEAGYKNGTIESVWKSFKEHKQHMNKCEYKQYIYVLIIIER